MIWHQLLTTPVAAFLSLGKDRLRLMPAAREQELQQRVNQKHCPTPLVQKMRDESGAIPAPALLAGLPLSCTEPEGRYAPSLLRRLGFAAVGGLVRCCATRHLKGPEG